MTRRFTRILAALALLVGLAIPLGMWGQAPVNTVLWGETWTDGGNAQPSDYGFTGTTVYGNATLTYANSSTSTKLYNEALAGGTAPELLLAKNNSTWTITGIPSGSATGLTLSFKANYDRTVVSTTTEGVTVETKAFSNNTVSYPISVASNVSSFVLVFTNTNSGNVRIDDIQLVVTTAGGGQQLTSTTTTITAPESFNNDLHIGTTAGQLSATVTYNNNGTPTNVPNASVTWGSSDEDVATVDANGNVTLVAAGNTNITATYAGNNTYASSTGTYQLNVVDNTPFNGVIFDATVDKDENNTTQGAGSITKDNVTYSCTSGILGNGTGYRMYKNSTTTIATTDGSTITKIEFIGVSGYPASGFGSQDGWTTSGNNGVWQGEATSVQFVASGAQVRATEIRVSVVANTNPVITAGNVNIAYDAISGSIEYTINNPVSGQNLTASVTEGSWLTLGSVTSDAVPFTCAVNEGAERTATVTLSYEGADDKEVTVTQAAAPVIYTTIPELFAAATSTSTPVTVNFGGWVVTGVNGGQSFVTDGTNGFIMYQNNHGFEVGNTLSGTVDCNLVLFNGSAEITGLKTSTDGLTVGANGTVTPVATTIDALQAVNTGSVVTLSNLTYNGSTLTDGTNTIAFYTSLYDGTTLVNGKTYNITGVFVLNNTTKRILPRSAADIEEVEVQHEEYTLTVSNLSHVNLFIFGGEDSETIISTEDGETTAQVLDGTEVTVSIDVEAGYVFQSLTITDGNGAPVETEELTANEYYSFLMPTSNVTITATAVEYVAPVGGDYVRITSLDQLTDGSKVIIAARHNATADSYYAMQNDTSDKPVGTSFTSVTSGNDEAVASTITDDEDNYYWTVNVTENGYTFTNANDQMIGYSSSTNFATDINTEWTIERVKAGNNAMVPGYEGFVIKNGFTTTRAFAFNGSVFGAYSTSNMNAGGYNFYLDFFVQSSEDTYTYELPITAETWYLIASPVGNVDIDDVDNLTSGAHGLYSFDQTGSNDGKEWRNYKTNAFSELVAGKGYLYINQEGCNLTFTGTAYSTPDGSATFPIDYYTSNPTTSFHGLNLVGNPFNEDAAINLLFYKMNATTGEIEAASGLVHPMEGVFVVASEDVNSVTFQTGIGYGGGDEKFSLNLTQNRGNVIDRAIVRFDEGGQLPKVQLFENSTKIYISQNGKDYAVVRSEGQGELPVNFRASENGTYTLSMDVENMDMNYLHLIDNMTGMDVDLLQTPSYTFEAKVNDYESRFRLVFAANNEDGVSTGSTTFAFYSNGNWIINNAGEATLQVVDLTGRILSSETVNGSVSKTINAVPGVYMLRLINGDNVNVQKIVVR